MTDEIRIAISRLEQALAYLKTQDHYDYVDVSADLKEKAERTGDVDWRNVETLITVAVQGCPNFSSYMDGEWHDFVEHEIRGKTPKKP